MVGVWKIVGLPWFCTKALGVWDSASKVDENWFVKWIARSSNL